jgi:chromosome segregation protein
MYLKALELRGFKSFVDARLAFQPGITAVVGPNGVGKSNILDAVLWVLGEQSTKTLRSERMEDVIFNGTESRQPLGMVEVSLILGDVDGRSANGNGNGKGDGNGNGSGNGNGDGEPARLPHALGECQEVMVTRRLFRDGVSEYFINKIPCRLKDLRALLLDTRAGSKGHTVIEQGRIDRVLKATPVERRELIEETAGIVRYKKQKAEALRKLEATNQNLLRVRDVINEVRRQLGSLERQARAAEQYQKLRQEVRCLELTILVHDYRELLREREESDQALGALALRESTEAAAAARLSTEVEALHLEVTEGEAALTGLRGQVTQAETRLAQAGAAIELLAQRASLLEEQRVRVQADVEHVRGEQQEAEALLAGLRDRAASEQESARARLTACSERCRQTEARLAATKGARADLADEVACLRTQLAEAEQRLARLQEEKAVSVARQKVLQAVRDEGAGRDGADAGFLKDSVAQVLSVPPRFERALEAVLGHRLLGQLVEGPVEAVSLLRALAAQGAAGGTFIPKHPRVFGARPAVTVEGTGVIGPARELVTPRAGYEGLATHLLAGVVVVETLEQAMGLWREMTEARHAVLVTLDGEVVTPDGMVSGSPTGMAAGAIGRERELKSLAARLKELEKELPAAQANREKLETTLAEETARLESLEAEIRTLEMALVGERKDEQSGAQELARWSEQAKSELARVESASALREVRIGELEAEASRLKAAGAAAVAERKQTEEGVPAMEEAVREACQRLVHAQEAQSGRVAKVRALEGEWDRARRSLDGLHKQQETIRLRRVEAQTRLEGFDALLTGTYAIGFEQAVAEAGEPAGEEDLEATKDALAQKRRRLQDLGPVNVMAIDEHRELEERLRFLTAQEADLTQSIASLKAIIVRINRTTKQLFLETFQDLQVKFNETFQTFFEGGRAELILVDDEESTEPGVDIVAQPPGKRLKNISMLSGGERALTAMALIFASFLIRPTPFCVLDEIDAPLDEENTLRFTRVIRELTARTQFIVITHSKQTMEMADALYGVTMEEAGVSSLVSVRLNKLAASAR